jgi:hypothetical protein
MLTIPQQRPPEGKDGLPRNAGRRIATFADIVKLAAHRTGHAHKGALTATRSSFLAEQTHPCLPAQQRESRLQPLRPGPQRRSDGQFEDPVVVEPESVTPYAYRRTVSTERAMTGSCAPPGNAARPTSIGVAPSPSRIA